MKRVKLRIIEQDLEILKGTFKPEIARKGFSNLQEYDFKNIQLSGNSIFNRNTGFVDLFNVKGLKEIDMTLKRVVSKMEG